MKFGLFYELQLPKPADRDQWGPDAERRIYHDMLEQVALADSLGFDYVFEVEHHFLEEYSHSSAPELMMALWLWATVDGVGSARQLARLCEQHLAYRWLCGGVSMNYHTLSDFRVAHAEALDQLLAGGVAALVAQGLVALDVLAQDGLKVRAAAGAGSFRRRERLGKLAAAAKARVERLRRELEADPAAGDRRQRTAQQRAARECAERVKAALDRMSEIEAERARREKTNKAEVSRQKEPRASSGPGKSLLGHR